MESENQEMKEQIEEARKEAIKRVEEFMSSNQVGYQYYVNEAMKEILKAKGIDWRADENSGSVD